MQIYLDTCNLDEIRRANDILPLQGVTTNPSLIMKEGRDYKETLKEICEIVDGPVSAETISNDAEGMLKEGKEFVKLHENIIIKVPLTHEGIKACRLLTNEGIKVNVTLCFSANQALLAAKAGAYIISPFVGRLDDIGQTGMELISEIKQIYSNYGFQTQILVASVRNPIHVKDAALIGADIVTIPYSIFDSMFKHSLTDSGVKKFLEDWDKVKGKQK